MTERFLGLAHATHERNRMPDAPVVVLPPSEQTEYAEPRRMAEIVDEAMGRFVETMVARPVSGEAMLART